MKLWNAMLIALSTYSRVPVPRADWTGENRRYALCFFPLVGVLVAVAELVWWRLWWGRWYLLFAAGCTLIPLVITGGIHMDGLMDTADALASNGSRQKKLEILKDSHVGAFAVMHCAGYLLLATALYSEAKAESGPLLGCVFILSRAKSVWALTTFENARPKGMLDAFTQATQKRMALLSGLCWGLVCLLVWALLGGWLAVLCLLAAALCLLYYRHMAYRQFGGVTGDLAGWFLQVTELTLTAVIVLSSI